MNRKLLYLIGGGGLLALALTLRAGTGELWRKLIFYGGAVSLGALKVFGIISSGALAWPFIILLGAIGIITDPGTTATSDTLKAQGLGGNTGAGPQPTSGAM
jgi:hypothetical protein